MKAMKLMKWIPLVCLLICGCNKSKTSTPSVNGVTAQRLQNLKNILNTVPSHGFMFGHQDATVYGIGWIATDTNRGDVKSVCGDFPAIMGSEVGHIELDKTMSLDSVPFDRIREHMIAQYNRGGLNTLSWHLDNPFNGGSAWNTSSKDSVVASVLEGGQYHGKFLSWLDRMAQFLGSLKTEDGAKIPVLFRPWHEHTGSWFWWGKDLCTPAQYKALWIMTHDYLQSKGVDNILYAYSPGGGISSEEYLERYPGDAYVDLLGFDCYQNGKEGKLDYMKQMDAALAIVTQLGKEHHKPIAITETGLVNLPDSTWWTETLLPLAEKYPISYVLVWRNAHEDAKRCYAPYPGQESASDFVKFYNNSKSLFCKEIQSIYK